MFESPPELDFLWKSTQSLGLNWHAILNWHAWVSLSDSRLVQQGLFPIDVLPFSYQFARSVLIVWLICVRCLSIAAERAYIETVSCSLYSEILTDENAKDYFRIVVLIFGYIIYILTSFSTRILRQILFVIFVQRTEPLKYWSKMTSNSFLKSRLSSSIQFGSKFIFIKTEKNHKNCLTTPKCQKGNKIFCWAVHWQV